LDTVDLNGTDGGKIEYVALIIREFPEGGPRENILFPKTHESEGCGAAAPIAATAGRKV
jgi:hypothetical protein